jgi:histidine triad (HIT) family protein
MKAPFILHIARRLEWENAKARGEYRADSLNSEKFIHFSYPGQVVGSANRHYRGEKDLVVLRVDESKLKCELKVEPASTGEMFPHLYGPLNADAVIEAIPFPSFGEEGFALPARAGTSIFSKIIRGELPCYKVHEDDWTVSILTREPIQLGHSLVIPKFEINHFAEMPEAIYSAVFKNSKVLSKAIQKATNCGRVGMVIAGWEVPHVHIHLIPTHDLSDFNFHKAKLRAPEENEKVQSAIIAALKAERR